MATAVLDVQEKTHIGVDKVARYGWVTEDAPGVFRLIPKKQLIINEDYQRQANARKVLEFSRGWSWIACGAITVAQRDGSYWVVDGQHRVLGARKRSDIQELPCLVFRTVDVAEEAQGFLSANANRKPVTAVAKHRAAVVAGDKIAVQLQALFDAVGVSAMDSQSNSPGHIRCVALARRRAQENIAEFETVLRVAVSLARDANIITGERLLDGLCYLSRNVIGGFDQPRLQKRLREVGAERLVDGAGRAAAFYAKGGAKVFAAGMIETINKGLQKRFSLRAE